MTRPLAKPFKPRSYAARVEELRTPGGIRAWLLEDHSLPMLAMSFHFAGGARCDPPGKDGLARTVGAMMDFGAGTLDAEDYRAQLAEHAVQIGFSVDHDSLQGRLACLGTMAPDAFRLLGLRLRAPRFDDADVAQALTMIGSSLNASEADPDHRAERAYAARAYSGHAYSRSPTGTIASIQGFTPEDIAGLHARLISGQNLRIAVVGAIDGARLAALLDETFGALPSVDWPEAPAVEVQGLGERIDIPLDAPSASIVFGRPAIRLDDPDFPAAMIANHVIGGGMMTSRLFKELREKQGLCYAVQSTITVSRAGASLAGATSTARPDALLQGLGEVLDDLLHHGIAEPACEAAKSYRIGALGLEIDGSPSIASRLTWLQSMGRDLAWIDGRAGRYAAVDEAAANRALRRLLGDGSLLVAVAGRPRT